MRIKGCRKKNNNRQKNFIKIMEINEQLFEDVLSGKLKGTFMLRNQLTCNSDELTRNTDGYKSTHPYYPYSIKDWSYTQSGHFFGEESVHFPCESNVDIVDFIPETNMKESELTIEIPNGKIVDWDESKKQNKIVLKDKQPTYEDICKKLFKGKWFFISAGGGITHSVGGTSYYCANNSATEHQLECILAKNKLANVAKYLNDGWNPTNTESVMYYLSMNLDKHISVISSTIYDGHYLSNILFKTKELAQQAIEILGEETVKLALEPLGI